MKFMVQETPVSKRITLIQKENYSVDLEYTGTVAIIHLPRVSKFTKDVYLDMTLTIKDIWEFLSTINYTELFAGVPEDDKLVAKLAKKMGFIYLGNSQGVDVYQYKEYL